MEFIRVALLVCLGATVALSASLQTRKQEQSQVFHWGYEPDNGPSVWPTYYPLCGTGTSQSPIDIVTSNVVVGAIDPFIYGPNWSTQSKNWPITNNGHTVQIDVPYGWDFAGGDLPAGDNYMLKQFHFHWGSVDSQGSEHTVNGFAYPIEMHIVMWDERFASYEEASTQPNGLAVLGIFFELSPSDNPDLGHITKELPSVAQPGTSSVINNVHLMQMIDPVVHDLYWRYSGSLTTPGCEESKVWSVFEKTLPISESQLNAFRGLFAEPGIPLVDNFRPTQPLNGRVVTEH